jgi:biotin carboxylase
MGTILFVSTDSTDTVQTAKRLGHYVLMMKDAELTYGREHVDEQIWVDPYDLTSVDKAVCELRGRRDPIQAVITTDERAVVMTACISEALELPGNTSKAAYAARSKFEMRKRFNEHRIPCPDFGVAETIDEAERLSRSRVKYPLVLKPLFGMASQGVVRINDAGELRYWFPRVKKISASYAYFVKNDPWRDHLLLESYMEGREFSVDAVTSHGRIQWIGTFDKPSPSQGPTFQERILLTPSRESCEMQEQAFSMVADGVQAIGLRHGPIHAELRLTASGPRILEIAARPIGGLCGRAHTRCLGSDYYEMMIANAFGEKLSVAAPERTPTGIMMLPVPKAGRFIGVHGLEDARRTQGIVDIVIMAQPGRIVQTFPEQGWYLGFIMAEGDSTLEVERSLNRAYALLDLQLEPLDNEAVPLQ